jgi:hypothetical protein
VGTFSFESLNLNSDGEPAETASFVVFAGLRTEFSVAAFVMPAVADAASHEARSQAAAVAVTTPAHQRNRW